VYVRSSGLKLAGTLVKPHHGNTFGAVILVPGSGHHDRDESVSGKKPFREIAEHLASEGISTLRLDSRGVGRSEGLAAEVTFETKVADLLCAVDHLVVEHKAERSRIALLGHSEGGLVAAAASAQLQSPVAMLATPALPMIEILHSQARVASKLAGATLDQLAHERMMNEQVFAALLGPSQGEKLACQIRRIIASALASWPDLKLSNNEIRQAADEMTAIVIAPDFRSLLKQDPGVILASVRAPLLALFGELDQQVIAETNQRAFNKIAAGNTSKNSIILPKHNHLFQVASSGHIEEYFKLGQSPSPQTLNILAEWLRARLCSP
jgi:pimeloyl-ACP methyl ester carboxylesterase